MAAPSPFQADKDYRQESRRFAATVRKLRQKAGLTLQALGERSGLSISTLSKIENGQLSPTYETLLRLADGLEVEVAELFDADLGEAAASGRRSVTRRRQGVIHDTPQYRYELLCADLSHKQFVPLLTRIKARAIEAFPRLSRHDGEEFIYVLSGRVELHTEHYAPMRLEAGDSCYFDSGMGHACVSAGDQDAEVLWVSSRLDAALKAAVEPLAPRLRERNTPVP